MAKKKEKKEKKKKVEKDPKKDGRKKLQLKYVGVHARLIYLKQKKFQVEEGDVFDVSKAELESFRDKEEFKQVK